jgi:hypothetical protein
MNDVARRLMRVGANPLQQDVSLVRSNAVLLQAKLVGCLEERERIARAARYASPLSEIAIEYS